MTLPAGPWATGVGSLPHSRPDEALDVVVGELGDGHVPFVPELPGRGVGSDVIGRGAAFLVDLPVDLQPAGWRLVDRPGADLRRARSWWRQDLDALGDRGPELTGARALKVGVTGPWTLAAALQRQRGEVAVSDPGARRDLVDSLAEGVGLVLADVRRAVPEVPLVLQVDEPSVVPVLLGRLPTASGYGTLRAVEGPEVRDGLRRVVDAGHTAGAAVVVHCCAAGAPVRLLGETRADGLSLPVPLSAAGAAGAVWEHVAGLVEAGTMLLAGVLDPTADVAPEPDALARDVQRVWSDVGLAADAQARLALTSTCGAAGTAPAAAVRQLRALAGAATRLATG
ncbi:methionine synthase [Aquipuribacter nitratireducens]|uniref:Methionine synthase n=1 Tax=Aquipuribacter nitratireducens TaxID=650104 RepID=A0ABW0GKT3_9MICO